jgi:hypothetical protein
MDVRFSDDGAVEFIVAKEGISMHFIISQPFKFGIDKWQFIRNGGIGNIRYEGCKMSCTPSNITLIFYEGTNSGTYQWISLSNEILELGIEIEHGSKTKFSKSSIQIPILECYTAIDKLIDYYEKKYCNKIIK